MNTHAFALAVATQTCMHGGMTISAITGLQPAHGYAIASGSKEVSAWSGTEAAAGRIARFLRTHSAALARPGRYLGTWLYGGHLYLGVAEVVDTADTAITLARKSGQLAVHDIANHADIHIRKAV